MQAINGKLHDVLFSSKKADQLAYKMALSHNYPADGIHHFMLDEVIIDDVKKPRHDSTLIKTEVGDKSMEGLALGGSLGGIVVGVLGAIAALSSAITIPGINLIISGSLAAGLVGAGAGSIAGGFLGALIGFAIPEERIQIHEKGIKKSGLLIRDYPTLTEDKQLLDEWKKYNGADF